MNARPHPPVFRAIPVLAMILGGALIGGALIGSALVGATSALAQKVHNTYGSPLDTIMNSHLTTDVPEAKDFVKETSPDPKDLKYTPLTGPQTDKDPERPKPRDPKGVAALRAELESAGVANAKRGRAVQPIHAPRAAKIKLEKTKPRKTKPRKTKPETANPEKTKPDKTAAKVAKTKRVAVTPAPVR